MTFFDRSSTEEVVKEKHARVDWPRTLRRPPPPCAFAVVKRLSFWTLSGCMLGLFNNRRSYRGERETVCASQVLASLNAETTEEEKSRIRVLK